MNSDKITYKLSIMNRETGTELQQIEELLRQAEREGENDEIRALQNIIAQYGEEDRQLDVQIENLQKEYGDCVGKCAALRFEEKQLMSLWAKRQADKKQTEEQTESYKDIAKETQSRYLEALENVKLKERKYDENMVEFKRELTELKTENKQLMETKFAIEKSTREQHEELDESLIKLQAQAAADQKQCDALSEAITKAKEVFEKLQEGAAREEAIKKENIELQVTIDVKKKEINERQELHKSKKNELQELISGLRNRKSSLKADIDATNITIAEQNEQIRSLVQRRDKLAQLNNLCLEYQTTKHQKEILISQKKDEIVSNKYRLNELKEKFAELEKKSKGITINLETLETAKMRLTNFQAEIDANTVKMANEQVATTSKQNAYHTEFALLKAEHKTLTENLETLKKTNISQAEDIRRKIKDQRNEYTSSKKAYECLYTECTALKKRLRQQEMPPPVEIPPLVKTSSTVQSPHTGVPHNQSQESISSDSTFDGVKFRRFDKSLC